MNIGLGMILCMVSVLLGMIGIYENRIKKPLFLFASFLLIAGLILCTGIYDPFAHHIR